LTEAAAASAAGAPAAQAPERNGDPLARSVFALLVLACFGAFFLTQRLKHTPTAVQNFKLEPYFSPTPTGRIKEEPISFKLSHTERITVQIVATSGGNVVATLVRNHPVERYKQFSLHWNGRRGVATHFRHVSTASGRSVLVPENRGRRAPGGEYRVRVVRAHGRPIQSPRNFTLVRR
jgi:hypothetical protein